MARINQALLEKLRGKLGVSQSHIYRLIGKKAKANYLSQHQAAIALAIEAGIRVEKYTDDGQVTEIRRAIQGQPAVHQVETVSLPLKTHRTARKKARQSSTKASKRRGTSIFVVHGRDEKLRRAMFAFLRSINLNPIEWREAIRLTGKANPFVAEILDVAFREAVAVVVLLSPDDQAKLKKKFIRQGDPSHEKRLTGQPRPNVLFEAGLAFGRNPESTVLVQIGDVRPFSDVAGRHIARLSNSTESRQELITKLANAGCNVQASGTDWHTEGDFGD